MKQFPTLESSILNLLDRVDPIKYGQNRNFIDGNVTYLSPYISRGVLSTQQVLLHVCNGNFTFESIESFLKELAWRDYFQRVWQVKNVDLDIKFPQFPVKNNGIPLAFLDKNTGIPEIDLGISHLYETGYMHNHLRMYTAMLACNIGQYPWKNAALWMYYFLLDGDWASNACSWQWVAGSNSSKKYFANQENINKFTKGNSRKTYLDVSYEGLVDCKIPSELSIETDFNLKTTLPIVPSFNLDTNLPTYLYTYYNINFNWDKNINANRVLILEPRMFEKYPVGDNCIKFILDLSKNIPNIHIYCGNFEDFVELYNVQDIHYKEHPLTTHFKGNMHSRDWLVTKVTGYYPSFFAYWKAISKYLKSMYFED